ncbi:hypothetical protein AAG906_016247 [Vitis piasezkii]
MSQRFPVDGMSPIVEKWEETSSANVKKGMYNLSEDMEMEAKVAAMFTKSKLFEPQQQANPCSIINHLNIWWKNVPPFKQQEKCSGNKLT